MMSPTHPAGNYGEPRVWWSFIVIVLGFVLVAIVSIYAIQSSQNQVRLITKPATVDIELFAKLSRDLDRKRVLIETHILEKNPKDMDRIEAELADVNAEITGALRSYELVGDDPGEQTAWQELDREIAALDSDLTGVLSLSRRNAEVQAKAANEALAAQYDRIDDTTNRMLSLNHARANQEAEQVRRLQRRAVIVLSALTLLWTLFALLTARWMMRVISVHQQQMNRAVGLLQEQNRELDAFAGRVAHDLRGPLTAIELAASQFRQRSPYDEATGGILHRAVSRMESMIRDLLTLSRVGAQTMGAACVMADVVAGLEEDLRPPVEAGGGTLQIEIADATVPGNQGLLRQVLWNLGENAARYRRPDVPLRLEIRGRSTPDGYELVVSDNGMGMSPTVARRAFEPFFRAKEAASIPGTGLGLSVVKRVVDASGGTVSLDSEPGQGTTFTIHLPRALNKAA